MSRFFLVEVGDDDELAKLYTTRHGVWVSLKLVNGVKAVNDQRLLEEERTSPPEPMLPNPNVDIRTGKTVKSRRTPPVRPNPRLDNWEPRV
jgi:hypothetical protein